MEPLMGIDSNEVIHRSSLHSLRDNDRGERGDESS
jgi:hypothetical protein